MVKRTLTQEQLDRAKQYRANEQKEPPQSNDKVFCPVCRRSVGVDSNGKINTHGLLNSPGVADTCQGSGR